MNKVVDILTEAIKKYSDLNMAIKSVELREGTYKRFYENLGRLLDQGSIPEGDRDKIRYIRRMLNELIKKEDFVRVTSVKKRSKLESSIKDLTNKDYGDKNENNSNRI